VNQNLLPIFQGLGLPVLPSLYFFLPKIKTKARVLFSYDALATNKSVAVRTRRYSDDLIHTVIIVNAVGKSITASKLLEIHYLGRQRGPVITIANVACIGQKARCLCFGG